jgi:hypothetical protein
MTASQLFSIANPVTMVGWIVLIFAIMFRRPIWRDEIAGRWFPLGLSAVYSVLIVFFFFQAEGGFDTLENVQKLFTSPWAALAGWIHYLAFDLFMGSLIARRMMEAGLPRWPLVVLLPLTFMFGPMGYLGYELAKLALEKSETV